MQGLQTGITLCVNKFLVYRTRLKVSPASIRFCQTSDELWHFSQIRVYDSFFSIWGLIIWWTLHWITQARCPFHTGIKYMTFSTWQMCCFLLHCYIHAYKYMWELINYGHYCHEILLHHTLQMYKILTCQMHCSRKGNKNWCLCSVQGLNLVHDALMSLNVTVRFENSRLLNVVDLNFLAVKAEDLNRVCTKQDSSGKYTMLITMDVRYYPILSADKDKNNIGKYRYREKIF